MDLCHALFYGDNSRHDEDATAWMQALNAKKVANDWSDKKAIDVFESCKLDSL